ncbi:MAG TPA: 50S ribosomal protein L11 methyltransferase [Stellaceae bacterium]|nr:50S ribosomal protein L11 methyltransferase [Stellaceae bacterium]
MIRDGGVWRVSAEAADAKAAERAAEALEAFCAAVSAFETAPGGAWLVEGFSDMAPDRASLAAALAGSIRVERLPRRDWVRENQESFPPRRVGRYFIYGSHHRDGVPAGTIGLLIDAATAFGTGEHATTAGCLRVLDALARRRRFRRILDMGTGTGILAIAAAKTWARPVLAVDIDHGSVRVARTNLGRNGVAGRVRAEWSRGYCSRWVAARRPYDLVLANILARPLAAMAHDLRAALAPGGIAVLSGLIEWQAPFVLAAHRLQGLRLVRRLAIDGWTTLELRRAPAVSLQEESTL